MKKIEGRKERSMKELEDGEWGWAGGMANRASLRNKIFHTYTCAH